MTYDHIILVGEKIHCSCLYKVDGAYVQRDDSGAYAISFGPRDDPQCMPVPKHFQETPDWHRGHIKPCCVAIELSLYGTTEEQECGQAYIQHLARV